METKLVQCPSCGAEIDLVTNLCPYCIPPDAPAVPASAAAPAVPEERISPPEPPAAVAASAPPTPPAPPASIEAPAPPKPASAVTAVDERERVLGLLLFEAEESLARGAAEKALVLASKAVKDRPDSLTARALLERARREMLRGRRREKLEARLKEAAGLFEQGADAAAEKIVGSALKLLPDHPLALELHAKLKERRLGAGTVEAEAEKELDRLTKNQARQALEAARAAMAAGWGRRAVLALRRGLRLVPGDPDLLAVLKEAQRAAESLDLERARRHALVSQVRAGLELLAQGEFDESLKILRAVLREDPDNARAQAAIQELRQARLLRQEAAARPAAAESAPIAVRKPVAAAPTPAPVAAAPVAPPASAAARGSGPPEIAAARTGVRRAPASPAAIPAEILLPRTRRRATPLGLVLGGGALLCAIVFYVVGRGGGTPARPQAPGPTLAAATPASERPAPPPTLEAAGPLAGLDPELHKALEATLTAYARALESADARLLETARPDLSAAARERRLAPFVGALNAATDIRVLDVHKEGEVFAVSILSTDVIVGGKGTSGPPLEETLRFDRQGGAWLLVRSGGESGGRDPQR